jgi:hypothetical protein
MKSIPNNFAAAVLCAGLSLAACAQPAPPPPAAAPPMAAPASRPHGDREAMRARMQERMARRFTELKQKLQITPAQEGAWNTFVAAMQPAQHQRGDRAQFEQMTTPERIDRMRALRAEHIAEMDRRGDATKTFYATLTAEQKRVFDQESLRMFRGARGEHGQPRKS